MIYEKKAENEFASFMTAHLGVNVLRAQLWRRLGVQEHPGVLGEKTKHTITNTVPTRSDLYFIHNMANKRIESLQRYKKKRDKRRQLPAPAPPTSAYAALPAPVAPAFNPVVIEGCLDGYGEGVYS